MHARTANLGAIGARTGRPRRFHQEGRAVGALNHPNIMTIYDADIDGPTPYVVTELLEGKTLRSLISDGSITTRKAIEYTKQIAAGLAAAHDKGITHRLCGSPTVTESGCRRTGCGRSSCPVATAAR